MPEPKYFDYESEARRFSVFFLVVGIIVMILAFLWSASMVRADVTVSCQKAKVVMLEASFYTNGVINTLQAPKVTAAICVESTSKFILDVGFKEGNPQFESLAAAQTFMKAFYVYGASTPVSLKPGS